jgi:soluble lytic murein transglycosylase
MKKLIFILFIIVLTVFSLFYFELPVDLIRPVFHKQIINKYSKDFKLDPLFITSIIKVESNFARRAKSKRGAIGLMQLMPSTAEELAVECGYTNFKPSDLENPEINIHLGMYYISKLMAQFQDNEILALCAYNAGISTVQTWYKENPLIGLEISDIPYEETRSYVKNVQRTYKWLKATQELKNLIRKKKA